MPKEIGEYILGGTIGVGSYAKVRVGMHRSTDQKFAIKIMDRDQQARKRDTIITEAHKLRNFYGSNAAYDSRSPYAYGAQNGAWLYGDEELAVRRDFSILKCLEHPNLVKLHVVMQTNTHMYLVNELINGSQDIFGKVQEEGRLEELTARKHFQELILGLRFIHAQRVAHRDLRPENLLIDPVTNQVKVSDMCVTRLLPPDEDDELSRPAAGDSPRAGAGGSPSQRLRGMMGRGRNAPQRIRPPHRIVSPQYSAPEILNPPEEWAMPPGNRPPGDDGMDARPADIWSCGVILFFMLTGALPFEDTNVALMAARIQRGEFRMAKSFSADVNRLIARMLTVDMRRRITAEDIVNDPWFLEGFDVARLDLGERKMTSAGGKKSGKRVTFAADVIDNSNTARGGVTQKKSSQGKQQAAAAAAASAAAGLGAGASAVGKEDAFSIALRLTSINLLDITAPPRPTAPGAGSSTCIDFLSRRTATFADEINTARHQLRLSLQMLDCNPRAVGDREIEGFYLAVKGAIRYRIFLYPSLGTRVTFWVMQLVEGDRGEFGSLYDELAQNMGHAASSPSTHDTIASRGSAAARRRLGLDGGAGVGVSGVGHIDPSPTVASTDTSWGSLLKKI